jgi:hypothetical protein
VCRNGSCRKPDPVILRQYSHDAPTLIAQQVCRSRWCPFPLRSTGPSAPVPVTASFEAEPTVLAVALLHTRVSDGWATCSSTPHMIPLAWWDVRVTPTVSQAGWLPCRRGRRGLVMYRATELPLPAGSRVLRTGSPSSPRGWAVDRRLSLPSTPSAHDGQWSRPRDCSWLARNHPGHKDMSRTSGP